MRMEDHEIVIFPNNIRLVHKQVTNTKIVHCGIILDIGSRDEKLHEQGLAHFWEHMAFKGTRTKKPFQIINSLESVGGELNAFTTKEKICFYASVLDSYFERAIELLTDITFNSIFPEKEMEKERQVILDEMLMYQDIPEDMIQDEFDEVLFPDHAFGRNILGTPESVSSFLNHHFQDFINRNLNNKKIVVSVVGNFPASYCRKVVEKYLKDIPDHRSDRIRKKPSAAFNIETQVKKNISKTYCALGGPAYSLTDKKRMKFFMLVNILGGPGMNSRLNMELREKRGLVYSIDASYMAYSDMGVFAIFYGSDTRNADKSLALVLKELKRMKADTFGAIQLHRAKEQLIGQLAMAEENNINLMIMMGRSILDLHKVDLLETIIKEIRAVSASELRELANEIFFDNNLSRLIFNPRE